MFKVLIKKKALKDLAKMPILIQKKLFVLIDDLSERSGSSGMAQLQQDRKRQVSLSFVGKMGRVLVL